MMTGIRHGPARRWLALVAALALAMRLALPAGFMPTPTAAGVVVALCSGTGGHAIRLDLGEKKPAPAGPAARACAFAAASVPLLAAGAAVVAVVRLAAAIGPAPPVAMFDLPGPMAARLPPPIGPPVL